MANGVFSAAAFAVVAGMATIAEAADWYTGAVSPTAADDFIVAVDAGATITSQNSRFASLTITGAAASNLAQTGPRVRAEGLAGRYNVSDAYGAIGHGTQFGGSGLLGYEWVGPTARVAAYGGLTGRTDQVVQYGFVTRNDARLGFKGVLELYARPTPNTMVQAYGSFATAYNSYFARLRGGVAFAGFGYIGPEVAVLGDNLFQQWRVGVHATAIEVGPFQFGFAVGYSQDQTGLGGVYTSVDARTVF